MLNVRDHEIFLTKEEIKKEKRNSVYFHSLSLIFCFLTLEFSLFRTRKVKTKEAN